ncbi:TIR domain-containing protein [bacterium]|nr:TIR domain-containing protein [bacterium]
MSAEVFVSYARTDRERVVELVERMRSAGIGVWVDEGGIHGASLWGQEIVDAIDASKVMVLMISDSSITSDNVVKELSIASEEKKPILPVYLQRSQLPKSMRYQLAGIQHIEFFEEQEDEAFQSMLVSLSRLGVSAGGAETKQDSLSKTVSESQATSTNGPESTGSKGGIVTALLALAVIGLVLALIIRPDKSTETPGGQAVEEKTPPATPVKPSKTSIVVLPFRNIGPKEQESFLADGMHEEIDAMLSMTPYLKVKNASGIKTTELDPKLIGESLKVDAVLMGTVRQSAGQLRVIVKLVDTETQDYIWASTFDKRESDVFDVQKEIAQKVVAGLKLELGQGQEDQLSKRQTKNLEAYNLFIQGRKMWNTRTREGMRDSIAKFELALAKDPNFALAHVGIADAYNQLVKYGHSPPKISYPKAREELKKALELNENLAEVHASIGWIYLDFDWDWDAAEKSLRKAISIDPNNPEARRWISHLYMIQGKVSDAIYEIDKGIELVPNSANMLTSKSLCLIQSDIKSQIDLIIEGIRKDPAFVISYADLAKKLAKTNEFEKALQVIADGEKLYPGMYEVEKAYVLASMGRKEEAANLLAEILSKKENEIVHLPFIADAYYKLGEMDLALAYFEEAIEEKHPDTPFLYIECDWFELFENTKFKELCGRMNLPPKTKQ